MLGRKRGIPVTISGSSEPTEVKNPRDPGRCRKQEQNFALQTTFIMIHFCFLSPQGSEVGGNIWGETDGSRPKFIIFCCCFRKVPWAGGQGGFRSLSLPFSRTLALEGYHPHSSGIDGGLSHLELSHSCSGPSLLHQSLLPRCCVPRGDPGEARQLCEGRNPLLSKPRLSHLSLHQTWGSLRENLPEIQIPASSQPVRDGHPRLGPWGALLVVLP